MCVVPSIAILYNSVLIPLYPLDPSLVDSEVTTPPLSIAVLYSSPYSLNPLPSSSKRPLELEDDENQALI
jgi:hypothetical protein